VQLPAVHWQLVLHVSVSVPQLPQETWRVLLGAHAPWFWQLPVVQLQLALQVSVWMPQLPHENCCVLPGAHAPPPVHAPVVQFPPMHVSVSVPAPQNPHDTVREVPATQTPLTELHVTVPGSQTSVVAGSRSSQQSAVAEPDHELAQGIGEQVGSTPSYVLRTSSRPGPAGGRSFTVSRLSAS
jgi:hypothetical protein